MPRDLLIDGYNLLHAAGLAKPGYGPRELQKRRATLLRRLVDLVDPDVLTRTTVIFDARINPPPVTPDPPVGPIRVIFSPRHQEADDVIEELLAKHSSPRQVMVVSGDHRLHRAALRRGATPIDSEDFLDQLDVDQITSHGSGRISSSGSRPGQFSHRELEQALAEELEQHVRTPEKPSSTGKRATPPQPPAAATPPTPPPKSADPLDDPEFWNRRINGKDR